MSSVKESESSVGRNAYNANNLTFHSYDFRRTRLKVFPFIQGVTVKVSNFYGVRRPGENKFIGSCKIVPYNVALLRYSRPQDVIRM